MSNTKLVRYKVKYIIFALFFALLGIMGIALSACKNDSAIAFEKEELTMYVSDSARLEYTVADEDAEITWSSSDDNIVTVRRGTVLAKSVGEATVTATVEGGSASCKIKVLDRTVTISQQTATIDLDSDNLSVTLTAEASDGGAITWATSDSALATVDNGVVTATGFDIGTVTITASRGAATAECVVTIVQPSRPADFYRLTMMTNANVVANPGTWYYHADGSENSDYLFTEAPYHANNSVSVSLSHFNIAGTKYFYFRYQPEFEVGTTYTISFTATMSNDGVILYTNGKNSKRVSLKAGEEKEVYFVSEVLDTAPFSIRIDSCAALENNEETSLTISDITVEEGDKAPAGSNDPHRSELADLDEYTIQMASNAEIVLDRGAWYYSCDGVPGTDYTFAETPKFDNGTVTFAFANMNNIATTPNHQLRYQPDYAVGTWYKFTAEVTLSAAGSVTYGSEYDGIKNYPTEEFAAGETKTIEYVEKVNDEKPFNITVVPADPTQPITCTVKNIQVTETEDPGNYSLAMKSNAEVVAAPGVWAYTASGADNLAATPVCNADGSVVMNIATLNKSTAEKPVTFQLRYQPEFAAGTYYTVTLNVKLESSAEAALSSLYLIYGSGENNVTADNAAEFGSLVDNGDGTYSISYTAEVDDAIPFWVQVATNSDTAVPAKLTLSDIVFVESTGEIPGGEDPDENPDGEDYVLAKKSNSEVVAAPGIWAYTSPVEDTLAAVPEYKDGVIIMDILSMIRDPQNVVYQLRYQPDFAVGTQYTVQFTFRIDSDDETAYITFSNDYKTSLDFSGIVDNGDGTFTIVYTDTVDAVNPFLIQVNTKSTETPVAIKVTISNISFVAEEPAEPEEGSYELVLRNNADTKANPGEWTYWTDNGAVLEATPRYENGSITFAVETMPAGSNCILRYQPDLEEGTSYTFSATIKIVSDDSTARFVYGYDYKSSVLLTPDEEGFYHVTWTGVVSQANQAFSIALNSDTRELPITLEITDIVITANAQA